MQKTNSLIFIATLFSLIIIIILGINNPSQITTNSNTVEKTSSAQIFVGNKAFNLEVADSNEERIRGLSYRSSLEEGSALLFVFDSEERHGIWMKDMFFSIDIVWLDKDKKIIHIEKNISPETFPKVFRPKSDSLYVIELSAGSADKSNIKIGDIIKF